MSETTSLIMSEQLLGKYMFLYSLQKTDCELAVLWRWLIIISVRVDAASWGTLEHRLRRTVNKKDMDADKF